MSNAGPSQWIQERTAILASSANPDTQLAAALDLAADDDPAALDALEPFLHDPAFLARFDDLNDPGRKTQNLGRVLMTLQDRPSPEIVPLCLELVKDPNFLSDPDRKTFLLEALAAVTPMNTETLDVFRASNEEGYYAANSRMLAANSSSAALGLLLEMMLDRRQDVGRRVAILHMALVPVRNRISVLEFVRRLVDNKSEPQVALGAIESIYDYQVHWRKGHPPPPAPWRTSSNETLRYLGELGEYLKRTVSLPESTQGAMERTTRIAKAILARRV